jgi:hypothetical protein
MANNVNVRKSGGKSNGRAVKNNNNNSSNNSDNNSNDDVGNNNDDREEVEEEEEEQETFWTRLFTLSLRVRISLIFSGAFIFLAALAWRDAVDGFINTCCPKTNSLTLKFLWAIIITVFVIIFLHTLDQVVLRITESDKRSLPQ